MKSARPADFTVFSFQLKLKWRSPRCFFFLPLLAPVKIDPLLPLAKMERVVWCPDQSDGGNGDGAKMKWHRWSRQWHEE